MIYTRLNFYYLYEGFSMRTIKKIMTLSLFMSCMMFSSAQAIEDLTKGIIIGVGATLAAQAVIIVTPVVMYFKDSYRNQQTDTKQARPQFKKFEEIKAEKNIKTLEDQAKRLKEKEDQRLQEWIAMSN